MDGRIMTIQIYARAIVRYTVRPVGSKKSPFLHKPERASHYFVLQLFCPSIPESAEATK